MNVLLINSSYRLNGNTAIALSILRDKLSQNGFNIKEVNLAHKNIQMCRGCRLCFDKGESHCPFHDDLLQIMEEVKHNDLIVFASPVYVEDINGIMKNWIDRMAFNCHRPAFFDKHAFIMCTSGVGTSGHGLTTIERALQTWGFSVIGKSKYIAGAKIERTEFENKYSKAIGKVVQRIQKKLLSNKGPSFLSIMTFSIQKRYYEKETDKSSADYLYWKNNGWLERKRHYYNAIKINKIRAKIADLLGNIIAKVVLK